MATKNSNGGNHRAPEGFGDIWRTTPALDVLARPPHLWRSLRIQQDRDLVAAIAWQLLAADPDVTSSEFGGQLAAEIQARRQQARTPEDEETRTRISILLGREPAQVNDLYRTRVTKRRWRVRAGVGSRRQSIAAARHRDHAPASR